MAEHIACLQVSMSQLFEINVESLHPTRVAFHPSGMLFVLPDRAIKLWIINYQSMHEWILIISLLCGFSDGSVQCFEIPSMNVYCKFSEVVIFADESAFSLIIRIAL